MAENKENIDTQKDGLALVVGGLFILALVFAAYNYFSKGKNTEQTTTTTGETAQEVVAEAPSEDTAEEQVGDINGDGLADNTLGTEQAKLELGGWVANNYNSGEIKAGNYTVKSGDTLWEIAEAAYGNGADWVKILDANKGSIDFLPNGSQALIRTGQVLVLP